MPHDKRMTKIAGAFADAVTVIFFLILLLWGEWLVPSIVGVFQ